MYFPEATSKFFYIYSVHKNSKILNLQLSSDSCVSQVIDFKQTLKYSRLFEIKNNCSYFSCDLFCKLNEIIVENLSIALFRVTTEWLLVFSTLHSS